METNDDIKRQHPFSRIGIFNKYTKKKMLKSHATIYSLIFSLILCIIIWITGDSATYYNILIKLTDVALSLFPNFLGFCIGGYALIIGASNIEVLKKMSKPLPNGSHLSFFQVLSSIFAASLIIQCVTLFFAYILQILVNMQLDAVSNDIGVVTNLFLIFILVFLTSMSILLLYYTVINIFNFGQAVHLTIRIEDRDNQTIEEKAQNNDTERNN
ncbi:hypothetical protein [uncultured Alistipes sp.]|mgnify:FL=1|uniref:hypothetical protein n=1 Tax=uncultured Alistipes sp. TaxID=538949 RepID=UPI0026313860|nr:hypothetical protein [uncultured Alistipes sp.]